MLIGTTGTPTGVLTLTVSRAHWNPYRGADLDCQCSPRSPDRGADCQCSPRNPERGADCQCNLLEPNRSADLTASAAPLTPTGC